MEPQPIEPECIMSIGACRIVLCKAATPLRANFIEQLEDWPEVELIATRSTLKGAIASIAAHPVDLLIADRNLPDGDGLEAIRALRLMQPRANAMIITTPCEDQSILEAIEVGASGYLPKTADRKELLTTIADLLAGRSRISAPLARAILKRLQNGLPVYPISEASLLTEQEIAILNAVAENVTIGELADQLNMSKKTLPLHVRSIYRKLRQKPKFNA